MSRFYRTLVLSALLLAVAGFFGATLMLGAHLGGMGGLIAVSAAWVVLVIWLADPLGEHQ